MLDPTKYPEFKYFVEGKTFNLTQQGRLLKENPDLYNFLKKAAPEFVKRRADRTALLKAKIQQAQKALVDYLNETDPAKF